MENLCPIDNPPLLLLDLPFAPGHCLEQIRQLQDPAARDLARMQYDYFSCRHEQAAEQASKYLNAADEKLRICALLIFTFANMAIGRTKEAQQGKQRLEELAARQTHGSKPSVVSLLLSAAKTALHLPLTDAERSQLDAQSRGCGEGGRLLCCYLLEQEAWDHREWERVIGSVETALHMTKGSYPLISLYFYLCASEAALHLKDLRRAETYFQKAWGLAEADGFWGPVGEMQGHLQVFLEKNVKQEHPGPYKQIAQATHQYRSGWNTLIREETLSTEAQRKRALRETLTGMEYAVAFLAGLGWSNQEIGDYFHLSVRTVKYYMTAIFYKLNINGRYEIFDLLD